MEDTDPHTVVDFQLNDSKNLFYNSNLDNISHQQEGEYLVEQEHGYSCITSMTLSEDSPNMRQYCKL